MSMAAVMALLAVVSAAAGGLGMAYAARTQAATAADAAALAAAVATYSATGRRAPSIEASAIAELNGARLVACDCPLDSSLRPRIVSVRTALDLRVPVFGDLTVHAIGRAEFEPRLWLNR